jgi:bifunctional UDP-N-acetylglucosamine pyrophosphorylase/glucosamine-1-phosphate N-acetyltransferase
MELDVIILAGGKGSRLGSDLPKPLHAVNGIPTLQRILGGVFPLSKHPIVVVGNRASEIMAAAGKDCRYVFQKEQHGTGHAVRCAKESFKENLLEKNIMVLPSDHPLIDEKTLRELFLSHQKSGAVLTLCTLTAPNFENENQPFSNYGRILRDTSGKLVAIREVKDATEDEKKIKEVNVGYYCFETAWLWKNIDALTNQNAAGEFYLTDMLHIAITQNAPTNIYTLKDPTKGMGFNTPEQLEIIRKLRP